MDKKFLNEDGLQIVADNTNTRLKTITEMPLTANNNAIRLYVGETTSTYTKGHIYQYNNETYYCYIADDSGYYYHFYIKEIKVRATVYACGSPEWFQKKADSISELTSDFSEIGYTFSITAASPSSITVSNGGGSIVANRSSEDDLSNIGWTDITVSGTVDINFNPLSNNAQSGIAVSQALNRFVNEHTKLVWEDKQWNGHGGFQGSEVWTDGVNLYTSEGSAQYVLNKSTSTWEEKTWNNLPESGFYPNRDLWTDGVNIYLSMNDWDGDAQRVLNEATSTWEEKTWYGLTRFKAQQIWKDGDNIYYSYNSNNYVLNKATSTWEPKTWYGLTNVDAEMIWADGSSVYLSDWDENSYILDKATSTWTPISWGEVTIHGNDVWIDGDSMYCNVQTGQSSWVSYVSHREAY